MQVLTASAETINLQLTKVTVDHHERVALTDELRSLVALRTSQEDRRRQLSAQHEELMSVNEKKRELHEQKKYQEQSFLRESAKELG